ncbi:hypothetical protein V8E53_006416 [Lactarius tabidus]
MSTLDADNDPKVDFNDLDEDTHHFSQPHMSKKAESVMSVLLPSSISSPSGLAVDTIAQLTHNELCHNEEFMKHIHMVDALQELLGLQEKTSNTSGTAGSSTAVSLGALKSHSLPSFRPNKGETHLYPHPTPISEEEWKMIHQAATIVVHTILGLLDLLDVLSAGQPHKKSFFKCHFLNDWADMTLRSVLDILPTHSVPPPNDVPPSCSSTPSSSLAPSCVAPSSVICSSNMGPPSTVPSASSQAGSSRAAPISHSVSATSASHTSCWAPHRAAPKLAQLCTPSELQEVHSAPLSASGSKSKHRRNPSPVPRKEKQPKGCVDAQSSTSPGSEASSPMYKGAQIVPLWQSLLLGREHTPLKTASEGASSEPEGIFNLESLKQDELMDWINDHLTEAMSKRTTKKGAISTAPSTEQPTQEEIWEIIQNCISKRNTKAA